MIMEIRTSIVNHNSLKISTLPALLRRVKNEGMKTKDCLKINQKFIIILINNRM